MQSHARNARLYTCISIAWNMQDKADHYLRTISKWSGTKPTILQPCILCAGCCSMQCNCTEGLHFSAFHSISNTYSGWLLTTSGWLSTKQYLLRDDCPLSNTYLGWLSTEQFLIGMIVHWAKLAQDNCALGNSYSGWLFTGQFLLGMVVR